MPAAVDLSTSLAASQTDVEHDHYSKRLLSLEEQGITVVPERRE